MHRGSSPLVSVKIGANDVKPGLVIGFTDDVKTNTIEAEHVFEVRMHHLTPDEEMRTGFVCWCAIQGEIVPVKPDISGGVIVGATKTPSVTKASGVAFIPAPPILRRLLSGGENVWVRLRGDFIVDMNGSAIDAEFVRAELPTGNRPDKVGTSPPTDLGFQGGLFESWFTVRQG
jgi:hypothetical protein